MPAGSHGMAPGWRTITLVGVVSGMLIAAPSPTAAADVGGLLGILGGDGSESPQPQPQPPPPETTPDSGASQTLDGPGGPAATTKDPLLAPESSCPGQSDPGLPVAAQARAMVCMLSYARVAKGLSALRVYKPLRVSATRKARDIRRCHRLSHAACGRSAWYWIARSGFFRRPSLAGELLAAGGGSLATAHATVRGWLDSRPHRAALLHPGFDLVGIGTVTGRFRGAGPTRIWVAHLGCLRHAASGGDSSTAFH
jgi:uncharacterized protein YkwD